MEETYAGPQSPQPNLQQNNFTPAYNAQKKSPVKLILIISTVIIILGIVGLGVYAYIFKIGPFSNSPYTEKTLLSRILDKSSKIKSASYSLSASFDIGERDADAKPFVTKLSNAEETKKKYENDAKRVQDISSLLSSLRYCRSCSKNTKYNTYPISLESLKTETDYFNSYRKLSIEDPATKAQYTYKLTPDGKNFNLSVTFETSDAVSAIKRSYKFSPTTTIINGKMVTFTKDSYDYIYFSSKPPKPFLVGLSDNLEYVPSEVKVSASISAQAELSNPDSANWKFNGDATGDFGDLTYKVNIDALRKDNIYYYKINNIPSIFSGFWGVDKGQWVKVDPSKASSKGSYIVNQLPEAEKKLKESREELSDLLKKAITIATNNNLITLKKSPYSERINGQQLYRYDLQIRKESILPFYQQLQEEISKTNLKNEYPMLEDTGLIEYLQSPEFGEAFDYYQKNTNLFLWTDEQGFPAIISYSMRIIPQDSTAQLKDKQGNLVFKIKLSDINKPVDIKAPADAKDIQSNPYYQKGIDSSIKSYMSSLVVSGEVLYDSNKSYSKLCSDKSYLDTKKSIDDTYGSGSKVTCIAQSQKWCASALLSSGNYFCVDSRGMKKEDPNSGICSSGACGS